MTHQQILSSEHLARMTQGPVSQFIERHFRHFNSAALKDEAVGYQQHLLVGGKMLVSIGGAMSTAEIGLSLAEMIRQDKVHIISCTGANLEQELMNSVAHSSYRRIPNDRDLTPEQERELMNEG
jgi:deoxyhypusine synthase